MKNSTLNLVLIAIMLLFISNQQLNAQGNVIAVTPDSSVYGVSVTLSISGHNTVFQQATSMLKFRTPAFPTSYNNWQMGQAIFGTNVSIINDSLMQATFNIPGGLEYAGLWDVFADTAAPFINGFKVYSPFVVVTGYSYYDDNGNCVKDANETMPPGGHITLQPGGINANFNYPSGIYYAELPLGTYTATATYIPYFTGSVVCPPSTFDTLHIATSVPMVTTNHNFGTKSILVSGYVYYDTNSNCIKDAIEQAVNNAWILVQPGNMYLQTDSTGFYSVHIPTGTYTGTVTMPTMWSNLYHYITCATSTFDTLHVASNTSMAIPNQNFALNYVSISGNVYRDLNSNCSRDTLENKYTNGTVTFSPGGFGATVDTNGFYTVKVPVGNYQGVLQFNDLHSTCCHRYDTLMINSGSSLYINNQNFGVNFNLVKGYVFRDLNGNCVKDALEPPYINGHIKIGPGTINVNVDSTGFYSVDLPLGPLTLTARFIYTQYCNSNPHYFYLPTCIDSIHLPAIADTLLNHNIGVQFDSIKGNIYRDMNLNCIKDISDSACHIGYVVIKPHNIYCYTDISGNYSARVASGNYTDTIHYYGSSAMTICNPIIYLPVSSSACSTFVNNDFGAKYNLLQGNIYKDNDGDCIRDASENPYYFGGTVHIMPGNINAGAYNGTFTLPLPLTAATYTITLTNLNTPPPCPSSLTVTVAGSPPANYVLPDFGLLPVQYDLVQGHVYDDANSNCALDLAEQRYPFGYVRATYVFPYNDTVYSSVDASGAYSLQIPSGNYVTNLVYLSPVAGAITPVCPASGNISFTVPGFTPTTFNYDFAIQFDSCARIKTFVGVHPERPCFDSHQEGQFKNISANTAHNVQVTFTLDSIINPIINSNPPWSGQAGNVLTYNLGDINPFQSKSINITDFINCTTPIGTIFHTSANATTNQSSCYDSNLNYGESTDTTTLSWDPNDKVTISPGTINITANDILTYKINFQNTGTDTAKDVIITDVLPAQLDPSTLITGISSHPYTFKMYGAGIAKFIFRNIMLPDSGTSQSASHGYVEFSINQKPGNLPGTIIRNNASIYFDYNPAVITNYTYNIIPLPTDMSSIESGTNSVNVYPNPFTNSTKFVFNNKLLKYKYSILIYDIMGKIVKQAENINSSSYDLNRDNLKSQIYFYRVLDESRNQVGTGKLIIID